MYKPHVNYWFIINANNWTEATKIMNVKVQEMGLIGRWYITTY